MKNDIAGFLGNGIGWRYVYGDYKVDCSQKPNAMFEWILKVNVNWISMGICSFHDEKLLSGYCFGATHKTANNMLCKG